MKNLSIVGTGLIGCSIAMGVKGLFESIAGYDINPKNLGYAAAMGIIDKSWSIKRIAFESDVIVVSVPVDVALQIIPFILNEIKGNTVVIDVGSTKSVICAAIEGHPKRANYVAAHPMAGSEKSGPHTSTPEMFRGRKVIVSEPEKTSFSAMNIAMSLFGELGLSVDYMDVAMHDTLVALVSHFPQIVSYGIAKTVRDSMNEGDKWWHCG